jgi:hypothetical protein
VGDNIMPEYISVTQYGEKHNIDVGNVRKMIVAGRINAIKIGNQWAIKSDEPRPADMRVKSGKYKNWRKKDDDKPD